MDSNEERRRRNQPNRDRHRRDRFDEHREHPRDFSRQHREWDRSREKKDRDNRNWRNNRHYSDEPIIVRKVHTVTVDLPTEFLINEDPQFLDLTQPKFKLNIQNHPSPPEKDPSRVDKLKDRITPIEKIWTSLIKQFLNDSEFVEIYRKNRSLARGNTEYGKTMIKYDEDDKSMHYENQSAQSKIFSRAYFKIWEILAMGVFEGKEKESLNIASVAEGPGGFIHAMIDFRLKHALKTDKYTAITLKIDENTRNAKDWSDFRAKSFFQMMRSNGYSIKLSYGETGTGDLLLPQNADHFAEKDLENKKCYLVTGDGGIECIGDQEFDYQQVFNVKLFLGEILAALKVQQRGGKFILKIYDCSFSLTRQLLTLLCVFYKKVRMIKPVTSRPGNSEKYMLCQNFLGMTLEEENSLKTLLRRWTEFEPNITYFKNTEFVTNILEFPNLKQTEAIDAALREANRHFLDEQCFKLEEGLKLAEDNQNDASKIQDLLNQNRFEQQMSYAYAWCLKYGLTSIDVDVQEPAEQPQPNQ